MFEIFDFIRIEDVIVGTAILLIVTFLLTLLTFIYTLVNHSRIKKLMAPMNGEQSPVQQVAATQPSQGGAVSSGVVFCRNCGSQYDSNHPACPTCRTPR
jgi:hypothetical protein